jgi:hypothetical protein
VGTVSEIVLERRSIPGQLRYLAAKLREGEQHRDAVALTLDVMADEMADEMAATPRGS